MADLEAEVLADMESNPETYLDTAEKYLVIDNDLRTIIIPAGITIIGVESDDGVNRLHFKMPRTYGEFDLSEFTIRINFMNRKKVNGIYVANAYKDGTYLVDDAEVDGDYIKFSWLVGRNAVKYMGDTKFIVCLKKTDSDGIVVKEFNTSLAILPSLEGLEVGTPEPDEDDKDVIAQLLAITEAKSNEAVQAVEDAKTQALEEIAQAGGVAIDDTLTESGQAADAKVVGDKFSQLSEDNTNLDNRLKTLEQGGTGGTGLSTEAIDKLEEVGNYLAYTTADGGSKWTELISILRNGSSGGGSGETVTLQSISATYTGGDVAVGTSLNDLIGITVTAHYSDGSTANVTGYTLSGTIAEGSNTITVSYGGKITTFTVTGVAESGGEETGVSNETEWTDGVPYTFEWVVNEYVTNASNQGTFKAYDGWYRSPYLYCEGASTLDIHNHFANSSGYNAFYDANKNYISSFSVNKTTSAGSAITIEVPENAVYFAVSYDASVESATGLPYTITPNA